MNENTTLFATLTSIMTAATICVFFTSSCDKTESRDKLEFQLKEKDLMIHSGYELQTQPKTNEQLWVKPTTPATL